MTLSVDQVNVIDNEVYYIALTKVERQLTELRTAMRAEGGEIKAWAHELMPIILILREAME